MRKWLGVACMLLVLCLWGCGSEREEKEDKAADKQTLEVGTGYHVARHADFEVLKISTRSDIRASMGGSLYYDNDNAGQTYVDILLKLTNIGNEALEPEQLVAVSGSAGIGKQYTDVLYAVESDRWSSISAYEDIAPQATAWLHCAISVPETETALTLRLEVGDTVYSCHYTLHTQLSAAREIVPGDTVEEAARVAVTLTDVADTDRVDPSNATGFYTYYEVDDPENTYLVVRMEAQNLHTEALACDELVNISACFQGKYRYTGFAVTEDADGTGFDAYSTILPLEKRQLYYLIKVPDAVIGTELELTLFLGGVEYCYRQAAEN